MKNNTNIITFDSVEFRIACVKVIGVGKYVDEGHIHTITTALDNAILSDVLQTLKKYTYKPFFYRIFEKKVKSDLKEMGPTDIFELVQSTIDNKYIHYSSFICGLAFPEMGLSNINKILDTLQQFSNSGPIFQIAFPYMSSSDITARLTKIRYIKNQRYAIDNTDVFQAGFRHMEPEDIQTLWNNTGKEKEMFRLAIPYMNKGNSDDKGNLLDMLDHYNNNPALCRIAEKYLY